MKIIIAGAYAIGNYLASLLNRTSEDITIIDDNEEALDSINSDLDVLTMQASPVNIQALRDIGTSHADLFIAVTLNQEVNVTACALAKSLGAKHTVARVEEYEYAKPKNKDVLQRMGVDSVIYPELLAAQDIINGLKMSWVRQRWDVHDGALIMLGIKLREGCTILNRPLKDLIGPEDPYHIVAIKRGNETIIQPVGGKETKLSSTIVNIVVGIAIGIAVACLLILPARISAAGEESDLKIKEIGEQLDEKNSTINALEQDKNSLTAKVDKLENELATYTGEGGAISSMDNLLNAAMAYLSNPEDTTTVASYLDLIDEGFVDTSTETFREVYGMLRSRIGSTVGGTYFEEGMRAYQNEQFDEAIENLSKAYAYDSSNVDALYNLANAYRKTGDNVNAISNYQTLVDNFPDTELATRSQSFLNELVVD